MKQKVVMKVSMNGDQKKSQTKAMKIAAGVPGVESVAVQGAEKDQITVTGDGIDPVDLTRLLRKRLGFTDLVSVTPVKDEDKKIEPKVQQVTVWPNNYQVEYVVPPQYYYAYDNYHHDPACSIM